MFNDFMIKRANLNTGIAMLFNSIPLLLWIPFQLRLLVFQAGGVFDDNLLIFGKQPSIFLSQLFLERSHLPFSVGQYSFNVIRQIGINTILIPDVTGFILSLDSVFNIFSIKFTFFI